MLNHFLSEIYGRKKVNYGIFPQETLIERAERFDCYDKIFKILFIEFFSLSGDFYCQKYF
jgi:hypothetical protein